MSIYRGSFPSSLRDKVDIVDKNLNDLLQPVFGPSAIINNEKIGIPYRTYFSLEGKRRMQDQLADTISLCLFTRHCNGYIRESSLSALLEKKNFEYFTLPYILKLSEEYVLTITKMILIHIKEIPRSYLHCFLQENPLWLNLMKARCHSYWNLSYRPKYYLDKTTISSCEMFAEYQDCPGAQIVAYLEEIQGLIGDRN